MTPIHVNKMPRFTKYSADELKEIREKYRREEIEISVSQIYQQVLVSARQNASCFIETHEFPQPHPGSNQYIPTPAEKVEVLKDLFPGTTVEYCDQWVEDKRDPNVKRLKHGFKIDWS